ncbi:MAG: SpoIID/LytB domain-containing protein [Candidatus Eisenbacteria sp.]|nr:SpoIID/LytB domain-containing protein [Candidatus Eisenbacteria bacterium]
MKMPVSFPWMPISPDCGLRPPGFRRGPWISSILLLCALCAPLAPNGTLAGAAASPSRQDLGRRAAMEPVVRIGLVCNATQAVVSCEGRVRVWRRGSRLRGSIFVGGTAFRIQAVQMTHAAWAASRGVRPARDRGLILSIIHQGRLGTFPEELIFEPLDEHQPLRVDGKAYRGEILARAAAGGVAIINAVHIEDYLRGVVPLEMGSSDGIPMAALEAQAVAARSYSLFYLGRRMEEYGCDLLAGPEDQVYGGMAAERPRATRAVLGTRGIVAVYGGQPLRANYCSTCGGVTEANRAIWPGQQQLPYLRPVRDQDGTGHAHCSGSPYFRWEERWGCDELESIVLRHLPEGVPAARGRTLGRLRDMVVTRRSASGRAQVLRVETDGGSFEVIGDRIRWVIRRPGGGLLRSSFLGKFRREGSGQGCTITLRGAGYGHGVGLCQYGAMEMARRGSTPAQILRHYYRGISLTRWW